MKPKIESIERYNLEKIMDAHKGGLYSFILEATAAARQIEFERNKEKNKLKKYENKPCVEAIIRAGNKI